MRTFSLPLSLLAWLVLLSAASAALTPISPADFGPGTQTVTFTSLLDGTEVNGLVVDGVTFQALVSDSPTNGKVIVDVDGGPGITNNINPPNLVSASNEATLALRVILPALTNQFGCGFAILATEVVPNAVTFNLFSGATPVGSIFFAGTPDPEFTGGFAGVASTISFDRVELQFSGSAFAVDNIMFSPEPMTVPEGGVTAYLFCGALVLMLALKQNSRSLA